MTYDQFKDGTLNGNVYGSSPNKMFSTNTSPIIIQQIVPPTSPEPQSFGLKYRTLHFLLLLTGLCFRRYTSRDDQSMVEKFTRLFFAVAYIILVLYLILCFLYAMIMSPNLLLLQGDMVRTVIMIIWMVQVLFTMIILFYWEIRDLNQSLLESSLQYETKNDLNCQTDWQTRLFLFGFLLMIIVRIIEVFIGTIKMDDKLVMYEILSFPFGKGFGVVLTCFIILHIFIILLISLLYYGLTSFAMRFRLQFLKVELDQLGVERHRIDSLQSGFYHEYRKLMQNVLQITQHFQFYRVLTMLFCSVQMTIGIYLFVYSNPQKWTDFMHFIIELAMVVVVLMTLLYPVSAIRSTLGSVKYILYYNCNLWEPYDEQTYELNKLYAEMAELVTNEISVFGATYARKPFFVTVGFIGFVVLTATKTLNFKQVPML